MADLPALLEKLAVVDGATTAVLMLPDSDAAAADARESAPLQARWLADAPAVQAALRRLRQSGEHTVIELPVVVETD